MRWVTLLLSSSLFTVSCLAQSGEAPKPKAASEVYKNLQVLGQVPANMWFPTMSFIADSLGVTCDHCHSRQFESDEKPAKLKARQMISMERELNEKYFAGAATVTCNSCHRGSLKPAATPAPNLDHWLQPSRAKEPLPAAADLISRYRSLVGAPAKLESRRQVISIHTSTYPIDGSVRNVDSEVVLGGPAQAHVASHRENGTVTYIGNGDRGWMNDGSGWRVMTTGQFSLVRNDLSALELDELDGISEPVTVGRERVYESDAYVVEVKAEGIRTWLFFDSTSGLLVRRRGFLPSYFGDRTWDVEYAQYVRYGKLTLPTTVRVINPAGAGLTVRTITARKLDVSVDNKLFLDPLATEKDK